MKDIKYKLDIFSLFNKIDSGDFSFYEKLSEEEKKDFNPLIIMRWMSGCNDYRQIVFINTFVNTMIFTLSKHPELLSKLLVISSSKQKKHYQWMGQKKSNKISNRIKILSEYFGYSEREAKLNIKLINNDEYENMANELGWQKDEIAKLKKELT
jgi:hypothetical protein